MIIVDTVCPFCGSCHCVKVEEIDYLDWQEGKNAQDAFPYLSADERELLISGICKECWDSTFGNESAGEDEEDDYEPEFDLDFGFDPYEGCYTWDC